MYRNIFQVIQRLEPAKYNL
ncbi:hypothetical protein KGM_206660 [Danaus plexippus plexippus]|uniref:Uncharacterized protein n=1 Tax=Danaus plexippus plexippus TaxID=278856 RepID=A0A212FC89_DANPL|nr:hypothetical protein KGM_206660 [Danaus plexippus plexippus]